MHLLILSLVLTVNGGKKDLLPRHNLRAESFRCPQFIAAAHRAFGLIRSLFSEASGDGANAPLDSGA